MPRTKLLAVGLAIAAIGTWADVARAEDVPASEVIRPINERFAAENADEAPDFRRHIVPLLGKLGCNGRACHGSFQGQGGLRLSLFGYDFKMDHESLAGGEEPRVDVEFPEASLMLDKPTLTIPHKGGKRFDLGSWEHRVLLSWIKKGAASATTLDGRALESLDVSPSEIVFDRGGATSSLKAIAAWSDGTREDVTPLCRFQTNDDQVAAIDARGLVTAVEPGDTHVIVFYDNGVVPVPVLRPISDKIGPTYPDVPAPTRIDELVVAKLRKLGVVPSDLSTDAEFLRRVSLDITGTLPSAGEVEQFLADSSSDKRARKIDELLERPAYAAWWTTRLCDITGNSDDALVNVTPRRGQSSQEWYDWIHRRVEQNVPYDDLIEGIVLATSRNEGESFADYSRAMSELYHTGSTASYADRESLAYFWARRNVRQPDDKALSFAYSFLGIRIQCAQCHKHPFDQWTQDDFTTFTGFFKGIGFPRAPDARAEYKTMLEELGVDMTKKGNDIRKLLVEQLDAGKVVPFDEVFVAAVPRKPKDENAENEQKGEKPKRRPNLRAAAARFPGGGKVDLTEYDDPRAPLMEWLREEDNPFFAAAFVNRVWAAYFNVGIVEPPDDLSLANPPSNKPLLDDLSAEFVRRGYDMKWLHREIANSRTYQLSWETNDTNRLDERNFSRCVPRRLPAEVAFDATRQATASDRAVAAMQKNIAGRAIAIAGAGNRSRRGAAYALTIFGKSRRESNCDCDRSGEPSLLQTVYLRNDQEFLDAIEQPRNSWVAQIATELGRPPAPEKDEPKAEEAQGRRAGRNQIARLEKRIKQLKADGKEQQAQKVEERLAKLRKAKAEAAAAEEQPQPAIDDEGHVKLTATTEQNTAFIKQAYLRTLSRHPREDEAARALAHLEQSDDVAAALRDLLWALVNTKEFIVNH